LHLERAAEVEGRRVPDELLYVLTDDRNGALLRIEPAQ